MILELLAFILLFSPLVWELITDANGDYDKKADVLIRGVIAALASILAYVLTDRNILAAFNLSVALHFMFFDYMIAIVLYNNGVIHDARWFSKLGKSGVIDRLTFWVKAGKWGRFLIRFCYLAIALFLYIVL